DRRRRLPAPYDVPAALGCLAIGVRADVRGARRAALLRQGHRTDLRTPLAARRGAAPVRRLVPVCCLLGLALVVPAVAHAHATPGSAVGGRRSPAFVECRVAQSVPVLADAIPVYTGKGGIVSGTARPGTDRRVVTVPVRHPGRGGYTIRWRVTSADSHTVSGVFTFGVRQRAPAATEAFGASGPTTTEHVVRWLYFLALALVAGGLAFPLLIVRRPLPPRAERRFWHIVGVGAVGA